MVVNKRKKFSRQRGSYTHGWGSKKKHRGKGSKGGKGMAGTGKRADTKKPSLWKGVYFGKCGFVKKGIIKKVNPVNLLYFENNLDNLIENKLIKKEGDFYIIDAAKIKFNKILGYGKLTKKYKITAPSFSKKLLKK